MEGEPDYRTWTDEQVQAEIDVLTERYWDLEDQIHEAELARAALMNMLKDREGSRMTIASVQFTDTHLILMVQSQHEGLTVRLHRDITIAALGKHLRELHDWLG